MLVLPTKFQVQGKLSKQQIQFLENTSCKTKYKKKNKHGATIHHFNRMAKIFLPLMEMKGNKLS